MNTIQNTDSICILCNQPLHTKHTVKISTGVQALLNASEVYNDGLYDFFKPGISVHSECRKKYTHPTNLKKCSATNKPESLGESYTLRSKDTSFDFKSQCMFCDDILNKSKLKYSHVTTLHFGSNIKALAQKREDDLSKNVLKHLSDSCDLVAKEAKYHINCYNKFFKPLTENNVGRPKDDAKNIAFIQLCDFIRENEECQYTISELKEILDKFYGGNCYSLNYLKTCLKNHFGQGVVMNSMPGKPTLVLFIENRFDELYYQWKTRQSLDILTDRCKVVEMASAIIREDIQSQVMDYENYPSLSDLINTSNSFVPETLSLFMDKVLNVTNDKNARKSSILKHAIVSIIRGKFISPIMLALSVHLHREYGSKNLLSILSNLGIASSYATVQAYENALVNQPIHDDVSEDSNFFQYVCDNADYNIRTLDGNNTFHSMGIIKCVTPPKVDYKLANIPRKKHIGNGCFYNIDIIVYIKEKKVGLSSIIAKDLTICGKRNDYRFILQQSRCLDTLWIAGRWLEVESWPSWNGFMTTKVSQLQSNYCMSSIEALPFINMDPNNMSTIYTALRFVNEQSLRQKMPCIVTFDQPLFLKAVDIVSASEDLSRVIVRLGGFHLLMSFLGCIGHIMTGSGIEEIWKTVYAKNSLVHMLSGHAYARSIRAHFLTQEAIASHLLDLENVDKGILKEKYSEIINNELLIKDAISDDEIFDFINLFQAKLLELNEKSRTAKLWIQYFQMVDLVKLFVRAERTGNWNLHIYTIKQMMPYFHAAGHFPYAKSAHLYVQLMSDLDSKLSPDDFEKFCKLGYFTIRRSDRFWSGIWSDMTIEQILMRNLKVSGGLTHGRGLTESTLGLWTSIFPFSIKIKESIEDFAGVRSYSSEQHVEIRDSRMTRDLLDLTKFKSWISTHSPFEERPSEELISLHSGVIADNSVNCTEAKEIGQKSIQKIVGKSFADISFKRSEKVKNLSVMSKSMQLGSQTVAINSQMLFNRILSVIDKSSDLLEYMSFELCPWPPSLFSDSITFRKTTKSVLCDLLPASSIFPKEVSENRNIVIDGGYLLHVVKWENCGSYEEIFQLYRTYLDKNFQSATIVFDGYEDAFSLKLSEQNRRSSRNTSANIDISPSMIPTVPQSNFLGNRRNKNRFISLLGNYLSKYQYEIKYAPSDADTLIVETALQFINSSFHHVFVIGNDTDILAILIDRTPMDTLNKVYFAKYLEERDNCRVFDIRLIQKELKDKKSSILFFHAFTGCDTTSAVFGKGKRKAYKLLDKNDIKKHIDTFNQIDQTNDVISAAGEKLMLRLYGENDLASINELRYYSFNNIISKKDLNSTFNLKNLPPTSGACQEHSFRVYFQIQTWKGHTLNPGEWGWKLASESNHYYPVTTQTPFAPDSLLESISCSCKSECLKSCGCVKAGINCSSLCKGCKGLFCNNIKIDNNDDHVDI